MKKVSLVAAALLTSGISFAQLSIDANLKTRSEYRHGQGTLMNKNTDPAVFISQRTRLGVNYKMNRLELQTSFQNVGIWGQAGQPGASTDVGLFEAWAKLGLNDQFSLKLGRQVISYDDQRILGGLDWAQVGRTHDAALVSYNNNGLNIDLGVAFNQSNENKTGHNYALEMPSYKTMQYLHLNKKWATNSMSLLVMNNGFQFGEDVINLQTLGGYINASLSPEFGLEGSAYYQMANQDALELGAYQARLELKYIQPSYKFSLGGEMLSGEDYDHNSKKEKVFIPLFGTNHAFNGFMDYFYVGNLTYNNRAMSFGLNDAYGKATFNVGGDANITVQPHVFFSNAEIGKDLDKYLGTEVDLVYSNKVYKDVDLNVGYSHMFASETMEILKGGSRKETNNWLWIQLYIRPNLFKSK